MTESQPALKTRLSAKNHIIALLIALLPLIIGLILFVMNPDYVGRLTRSSPSQPLGWVITAFILIFSAATYGALLASTAALKNAKPPAWLSRPGTLRTLLFGAVFVLCILPNLFLVMLGPAVLLIIEVEASF